MTKTKTGIVVKTTELVENHNYLAILLAVLCLAFAVNLFLTGPGSDGGSGLGGTGKFGGESGLGGTGKAPDPGSAFKLGAADGRQEDDSLSDAADDFSKELEEHFEAISSDTMLAKDDLPILDVNSLRLTPQQFDTKLLKGTAILPNIRNGTIAVIPDATEANSISDATTNIDLDTGVNEAELVSMSSSALVTSFEIMSSLMTAQAEMAMQIATLESADTAVNSSIRNRVNKPVRPERPDRFTIPARISPVQRANIPTPPPVRPMRTLSSLLNQ